MSAQQPLEYWCNHITQYDESNLSRQAYCKVNNVNYPQFLYWKNKLRKIKSSGGNNIIPVTLGKHSSSPAYSITLSNGIAIGVHSPNGLTSGTVTIRVKSGHSG